MNRKADDWRYIIFLNGERLPFSLEHPPDVNKWGDKLSAKCYVQVPDFDKKEMHYRFRKWYNGGN